MDALHIDAIVSDINGRARWTSQVGAGSSEQCLAGEQPMIFVILAVVAILISDRTLHRLSSKSSAVGVDTYNAPVGAVSNALTFDHNAFGSPVLFLIAADQ